MGVIWDKMAPLFIHVLYNATDMFDAALLPVFIDRR